MSRCKKLSMVYIVWKKPGRGHLWGVAMRGYLSVLFLQWASINLTERNANTHFGPRTGCEPQHGVACPSSGSSAAWRGTHQLFLRNFQPAACHFTPESNMKKMEFTFSRSFPSHFSSNYLLLYFMKISVPNREIF